MSPNRLSPDFIQPTTARPLPRRSSGFTLVELLVTITIIITLAVLSVVGVRSIRQKAMAATASASLRQNGVAIISYVTDKGHYPQAWDDEGGGGSWSWQIRDHLNYQSTASWPVSSLLHPRHGTKGLDKMSNGVREGLHHFSASATILQDVNTRNNNDLKSLIKAARVNNPATTIMLGDAPLKTLKDPTSGCHAAYWDLRYNAIAGNPNSKVDADALKANVEFWMNGKAHFLFADGHVETLSKDQVLRKHFRL